MRNLVDAGFRPQVIMSLLRRNRGQMEELVRLAESLGAGSVKFNMVQPTARGERLHEAGETLFNRRVGAVGTVGGERPFSLNKSQALLQPSYGLSSPEQNVRPPTGRVRAVRHFQQTRSSR